MKFLSNNYKKYVAAAATVFAAIAIPAQATDCTTVCQSAAQQAGNAAVQAQVNSAQAYCTSHYDWYQINNCMNSYVPTFNATYNSVYQQTYAQCMGSCH